MGAHDERAWGPENLEAFAKFVRAQGQALSLLCVAQEHDERMLVDAVWRVVVAA